MKQEYFDEGRIFNIRYPIWRNADLKKARMKKKKKTGVIAWMRSRPFTLLAFALAVMTMVLIVQLPRKMGGLERQDEQLKQAMETYSDLQAEHNVLRSELARINDEEYIETIARRKYGYGWYGETIYEIGNLEEIQAAQQETQNGDN